MTPLQKKLKEAKEYAGLGKTSEMDNAVLDFYEIARELGHKINHEEVKDILTEGYINSISNGHEAACKEHGDLDLIMGIAGDVLKNAAFQYRKLHLLDEGGRPYDVARIGKN